MDGRGKRMQPLKIEECIKNNCQKIAFKNKLVLSKDFRNLYRSPETAYASMDFKGKGFITQEDLINSLVFQKHLKQSFTIDDINVFLSYYNLFPLKGGNRQYQTESGHDPKRGVMIFDTFKKTFFAYLHQTFNITEIMHDAQDEEKISSRILSHPEYVKERLRNLENFLKDKFAKNWVSVRKAFLDLDTDHDGYISVEDIIKYFGTDNEVSFQELKKLLQVKDQKQKGLLSYSDFSRWVGNSIHSVQGFYFRHDSVKNPVYEKFKSKYYDKVGKFTDGIRKDLINQDEVIKIILDKIQFQWKTIRKSFHEFSKDKSGGIEPEELKFYFDHWGIYVSDETFKKIYEQLDWDKDGKISYSDFQKTVGCEIHPGESLYFRQDQPTMLKINTCKHMKCWQPTKQGKNFCQLHIKVNQDIANAYYMSIYKTLGKRWRPFINEVKRQSETIDHNEIKIDTLVKILNKFRINVKEQDKEHLLDTYPGNDEGQRILLNISSLYQMRQQFAISQTYQNIAVEDSDSDDVPVDLNGYTGDTIRAKDKLKQITNVSIDQILGSSENRFVSVMRLIRMIDKDNNGYVTVTEIDDILKLQYEEFQGKDLHHFIKQFRSIQNKILVDYKKLRDYVVKLLKIDAKTTTSSRSPRSKSEINMESKETLENEYQTSPVEINMSKLKIDVKGKDNNSIEQPIQEFNEYDTILKERRNQQEQISRSQNNWNLRKKSCLQTGIPNLNSSIESIDVGTDQKWFTLNKKSVDVNKSQMETLIQKDSQQSYNNESIINLIRKNDYTSNQKCRNLTRFIKSSLSNYRKNNRTLNVGDNSMIIYDDATKQDKTYADGQQIQQTGFANPNSRFINEQHQSLYKTISNFPNLIQDKKNEQNQLQSNHTCQLMSTNVTLNSKGQTRSNLFERSKESIVSSVQQMEDMDTKRRYSQWKTMESGKKIKVQLAERIKEFRKELKDSEKKHELDGQGRFIGRNDQVDKFRRTVQSLGLDLSQSTLTKIMTEQ